MNLGRTRGVMDEGLKRALKDQQDWIIKSFGKYEADELTKRVHFDILISPPGHSRRQILFGLDAMYNVIENSVNKSDKVGSQSIVFEDNEYGGTYDRPWILSKLKYLNDQGEVIRLGRIFTGFRRVDGQLLFIISVWKIISPQEEFNVFDYLPEMYRF